MRYFQGHRMVVFPDELKGMRSGLEPFPRVFFVSRILYAEGLAELRALTLRAFFGAVFSNIAWDIIWGLRQLAWRIGFIDFDERRMGEASYHGDWRWRWWLPRVGRAPGGKPASVEPPAAKEFVQSLTEAEATVPTKRVEPPGRHLEGPKR